MYHIQAFGFMCAYVLHNNIFNMTYSIILRMSVYPEINPFVFSGPYSQESVYRISALVP